MSVFQPINLPDGSLQDECLQGVWWYTELFDVTKKATDRNALNELIKSYPWLGVSILPELNRLLSTSVMELKKKIKAYRNSSLF